MLENISVITGTYAGSGSTPAYAEKHGVGENPGATSRRETAGWPGNGVQVIATAPGAWSNATTYALGDTASYLGNYYHSARAGKPQPHPDRCRVVDSWGR